MSHEDPRAVEGVQRYLELFGTIILPRASGIVFPGVASGGVHRVDRLRDGEPTWVVDTFAHVVSTIREAFEAVALDRR